MQLLDNLVALAAAHLLETCFTSNRHARTNKVILHDNDERVKTVIVSRIAYADVAIGVQPIPKRRLHVAPCCLCRCRTQYIYFWLRVRVLPVTVKRAIERDVAAPASQTA